MTHSARWIFLAALLPVAACSSNAPPVAAIPPAPPPLAPADQSFISAAAASDAFEVQAGQLAQTKGRSTRVKTYGKTMVSAHTQTTQQLTQIASAKGVTPMATLNPDQQKMLDQLQKDRPAVFDRDYLRDNITAHKATEQAFQDEIGNGQDTDLKQFATTTLPTIQQHIRMAGGKP